MTESAISYLRRSLALPPFHQWLQPEVIEADEATGKVIVALPIRPEFRRDPEQPDVHGGILAALIDIAGHAAIAGNVRRGVPTIDLRIDYVRMASGTVLKAEALPVRVGRSIGVVDVRVTDDKDVLVALGRGVFSTRTG